MQQSGGGGNRTENPGAQGEWIIYSLQHRDYIWLSTSTTCVDPGIFARGGGGGVQAGLQETALTKLFVFFSSQLILQLYSGLSMVSLKENYKISKVSEGGPAFSRGVQHLLGGGGGVQLFPGGRGSKC